MLQQYEYAKLIRKHIQPFIVIDLLVVFFPSPDQGLTWGVVLDEGQEQEGIFLEQKSLQVRATWVVSERPEPN